MKKTMLRTQDHEAEDDAELQKLYQNQRQQVHSSTVAVAGFAHVAVSLDLIRSREDLSTTVS